MLPTELQLHGIITMANTDTTMPPEVAEAIAIMDAENTVNGSWNAVRDHLHRLAEENARLNAECKQHLRQAMENGRDANHAESERDALKARIAEAPKTSAYADGDDGLTIGCGPHILACMDESEIGECFAIVKLENGE